MDLPADPQAAAPAATSAPTPAKAAARFPDRISHASLDHPYFRVTGYPGWGAHPDPIVARADNWPGPRKTTHAEIIELPLRDPSAPFACFF